MLYKKILLFLIFKTLISSVYSQDCDCDIFPVKKECKQNCGLVVLQSGTKDEIVKKMKVKDETAQRIVKIQNRKNYKKVSDFEEELPLKYYKDLEGQYEIYINENSIQNNVNGDNVAGNKIMGNVFSGNPLVTINSSEIDTIKYKNKNIRVKLGEYYIRGCELRDKCRLDSNYVYGKVLEDASNIWFNEVLIFLKTNLDYSYVAQFYQPKVGLSMTYPGLRKEYEGLYAGLIERLNILNDFMTTLR
jgi:hypothetical protein